MRREMREETEYLVQNARGGPSNSGLVYLAARKTIDVGVPYYLKRARVMAARYSRGNTLYRLVHLRVASHALADRVHHFGESESPNCPCGCGLEETPAYFVFGSKVGAIERNVLSTGRTNKGRFQRQRIQGVVLQHQVGVGEHMAQWIHCDG